MNNHADAQNKKDHIEIEQQNLNINQKNIENEHSESGTNQANIKIESSRIEEANNSGAKCSSSEVPPAKEQLPSQTDKNWNSINVVVEEQKTPIKNKDEKEKKPEFKFFEELSKRFVDQQDQIIEHRKRLLKWFAWITASQLIVINVLIFICIFGNKEILDVTLSFMKFFVGATFLELLGGLLIIVKFVFSHETYDMLKHLTYVEPSAKK